LTVLRWSLKQSQIQYTHQKTQDYRQTLHNFKLRLGGGTRKPDFWLPLLERPTCMVLHNP